MKVQVKPERVAESSKEIDAREPQAYLLSIEVAANTIQNTGEYRICTLFPVQSIHFAH